MTAKMATEVPEGRRPALWKPELYKLQLEAPRPLVISCKKIIERPIYFGPEYHGVMSHKEAIALLRNEPNGSYLVRKGSENNPFYTMTWKFNNQISHFKLYYDGRYFVKEKRYESMFELTMDGLIQSHIQLHAAHITELMHEKVAYKESPYVTLNRRRLRALSNRNKDKIVNEKLKITTDKIEDAPETGIQEMNLMECSDTNTIDSLTNNENDSNILIDKYNCGFIAHAKCAKLVPHHCMPDLKKFRGVFGIDLTTLLNAHSSTLPFVVTKCVKEIESRGMEQEGIYRISGFADEIEALKMALDKDGETANLSEYANINVIAGCLKLYLRLLPVPLLTHQLHPNLVKASYLKTPSEQIKSLRETLTDLPPAHYITLQYMIQHLYKVSLLSNMNKMTAHNLSTVFAPTLMAMPPQCTDLTQEIYVLEILITHSTKIFGS